MHGTELDDVDRRILDLLREDARRTVTDIARRVSLSAAPVKRRIDRLEEIGVIAGYTVVLDEAKLGRHIDAFVELKFAGHASVEEISATVESLSQVRALFMTAGDPDALVWLSVEDLSELKRSVNQLRRSQLITGTKTLMVLDTWTPGQLPA
jgi:Lrp/AsnC family transcriptional regulator, leucine-responsive regulatory protein